MREKIREVVLNFFRRETSEKLSSRMLFLILSNKKGADVLYQAGLKYGRFLAVKKKVRSMGEIFDILREEINEDITMIPEDGKINIIFRETPSSRGLGDIGMRVCHFEAGMIAGIFSQVLGRKVGAVEKKCIANGDKYCEFAVFVGEQF